MMKNEIKQCKRPAHIKPEATRWFFVVHNENTPIPDVKKRKHIRVTWRACVQISLYVGGIDAIIIT